MDHTQATHAVLTDILCTARDKTFSAHNSFSSHHETIHGTSQGSPLSPIPQFDGNNTLDSAISDVSHIRSSTPADLTYNYSVNPQNQTRRLLTSAQKPPLSITTNHYEVVNNIRYAFNVNVEFNSGVYMTAIKPVLEAVNTDWLANVDRWSVSCSKVSNRQDSTHRHLLCTVLHLGITDNDLPGASQHYKVTVHFL